MAVPTSWTVVAGSLSSGQGPANLGEGGREVVADLLARAAQERVAEDEPAMILEDAQRFADPVRARIDDPGRAGDVGRLAEIERHIERDRLQLRGRGEGGAIESASFEKLARRPGQREDRRERLIGRQAPRLGEIADFLTSPHHHEPERGRVRQ